MLVFVVLAMWLFNPKGSDWVGGKSAEEHMRELEQLGLTIRSKVTLRPTRVVV